jgi:hypothetical protein
MKNYALAHYAQRRGSLQTQPSTTQSTSTQQAGVSYVSLALFGTAAALYYTRDPSVIKAAGAGLIAPIYLTYRGVQYAQKKMK